MDSLENKSYIDDAGGMVLRCKKYPKKRSKEWIVSEDSIEFHVIGKETRKRTFLISDITKANLNVYPVIGKGYLDFTFRVDGRTTVIPVLTFDLGSLVVAEEIYDYIAGKNTNITPRSTTEPTAESTAEPTEPSATPGNGKAGGDLGLPPADEEKKVNKNNEGHTMTKLTLYYGRWRLIIPIVVGILSFFAVFASIGMQFDDNWDSYSREDGLMGILFGFILFICILYIAKILSLKITIQNDIVTAKNQLFKKKKVFNFEDIGYLKLGAVYDASGPTRYGVSGPIVREMVYMAYSKGHYEKDDEFLFSFSIKWKNSRLLLNMFNEHNIELRTE